MAMRDCFTSPTSFAQIVKGLKVDEVTDSKDKSSTFLGMSGYARFKVL